MAELLEPWLGAGGLEGDLPIPAMIDAELIPGARADALRPAVTAAAPSARIDDNGQWLAPLGRLISALKWLAAGPRRLDDRRHRRDRRPRRPSRARHPSRHDRGAPSDGRDRRPGRPPVPAPDRARRLVRRAGRLRRGGSGPGPDRPAYRSARLRPARLRRPPGDELARPGLASGRSASASPCWSRAPPSSGPWGGCCDPPRLFRDRPPLSARLRGLRGGSAAPGRRAADRRHRRPHRRRQEDRARARSDGPQQGEENAGLRSRPNRPRRRARGPISRRRLAVRLLRRSRPRVGRHPFQRGGGGALDGEAQVQVDAPRHHRLAHAARRFELSRRLGGGIAVLGDAVESNPSFAQLFTEYNKYLLRRSAVLVGI